MNLPAFSSVTDYVAFHADASSDVNAISSEKVRLSYSEVADEVDRYARALQGAGVGPGTFVGVLGPSRPECFIAFLACCRIGAAFAGLNPRHTVRELSVVVTDCQPTVILCLEGESSDDDLTEKVLALRPALNAEAVLVSRTHRTEGGLVSLNDFLDEGRHVELTSSTSPDSPAAIVYTSGSTGTPKGALLSQRSLVRSAHLSWEYWYDAPVRPRTVTHHPISHVGWLVTRSLATFIAGGSINVRERFDPREHLRLIEQEKVTVWNLHPSELVMTMETDVFSTCDLSSVEHVAFGTSPSLELVNVLQERTDAVISVSYGLTEACGGAVIATSTDPKSVTTTVGRVLPGVEIRIVTKDGADAETGTPGELLIRDECVFSGYLNRPEEARSVIDRDGWLHTGDVVTQASDGSISLTGRLTEMFKSGGYNIYPSEIEQVLASHPAVWVVAVVAAPDPRWTQVGVAFVVTKPGDDVGEDDLNEFCRKHLANYKVPKRFEFVPSLPQLRIAGKIDRLTLRSEAERLVTEASADREAGPLSS